jgi:site-specific DNA-methyltransferase (adenine-specific)
MLTILLHLNTILNCDVLAGLKQLEDERVDTIMTSPPYYALRDYQVEGQIGLEKTIDEYINKLIQIFNECKRVLKKTGSCWIVLGDTYQSTAPNTKNTTPTNTGNKMAKDNYRYDSGLPAKSLLLIPERFAIKMIDNGWILRNKIIWQKRNVIPSSAKDRYTVDYENVYFCTKSPKYYFNTQYEPYSPETLKQFSQIYRGKGTKDYESNDVQNPSNVKRSVIKSLKMPPIGGVKQAGGDNPTYSGNTPPWKFGRIKRTVWTINTKPFKGAHFAVFPEALVKTVIEAGCPINGVILDPFMGAGTVALVALKMNRNFIGIELNKEYVEMAYKRIDPYLKQEKLIIEST